MDNFIAKKNTTIPAGTTSWFHSTLLILIILLATAERIYGIDRQSLWSDELFAVMASYIAEFKNTWPLLIGDSHPPGYVSFMYWTLPLTGYSDFGIRLHALIFGIAWIPITFYICKRWLSADTGLLAATLTASAYSAIYFSQEARAYSMLITFMLLNLACFLEILFGKASQIKFTYGFIISAVLFLYFHYSGFVFYSTEILLYAVFWVLGYKRGNLSECFKLFAVPLLIYLPWFLVMARQILDGHSEWAVSAPPTGNQVLMLMQRLFGPDFEHFQFYSALLAVSAAIIFSKHLKHTLQRSHLVIFSIFFLAAIPVFAFYVKSLISTPIFEKRYFLHAVPFMAIIAAYAIHWILKTTVSQFWKKPALFLFIIAYSAWTINTNVAKGIYSELDKDPVREAAMLIRNDVKKNNLSGNYTTLMTYNWFEHYLSRNNIKYDASWQFHVFYIPQQLDKVQKYLADNTGIDYFYYLEFEQKGPEYAAKALRRQYRLLSTARVSSTLFDINVLKFSAKEHPTDDELKTLGSTPTDDAITLLRAEISDIPADAYTTVMTHDWIEPYLQRHNIHFDGHWANRKFYADWQAGNISQYLAEHPAIEKLYFVSLREASSETAFDILRTRYKLTYSSSTQISAGTLDIYGFDTKSFPAESEVRSLQFSAANKIDNAISKLKADSATLDPEKYAVTYTHDWMEAYLVHNGLHFDPAWATRKYVIDAQEDLLFDYIKNHPAVETLYYIALEEPNSQGAALMLQLRFKLTSESSFETSAGKVTIFTFNTKLPPIPANSIQQRLAASPTNAIAKWVRADSNKLPPGSYTTVITHDWMESYLKQNDVHIDADWSGRKCYIDLQTEQVFDYVAKHPSISTMYYLALRDAHAERASTLLQLQYEMTDHTTIDIAAGKVDIFKFNTLSAPTDIITLRAKLVGSPLDDIATWVAHDISKLGHKSSTIIMTHDWFKPYLREHDIELDNKEQGHYFSDNHQLAGLSNYLQSHPELEYLYYLALPEPSIQLAINSLKAKYFLSCEKFVEAPVGKISVMRFNIKQTAASADATTPICSD